MLRRRIICVEISERLSRLWVERLGEIASTMIRDSRGGIVLPAAAERFVERNDGEELVSMRAREIELRRKKLLLRFENLVVARFPGNISLRRKFHRLFESVNLASLVPENFRQLLARDQRIRHFAERIENGLLVAKLRLLSHRLRLPVLSDEAAPFKQRPRSLGCNAPNIRATQGECRQFRTGFAKKRRESNFWKKFGD